MVLVFYRSRKRKQGTAGEDTAGSAVAVCVVPQPDHVLVHVAPVTATGAVLEEEGQGFALWGGATRELGDPPGIQALFLRWMKDVRPSGAERIRVIDFQSGQQIGEAVRDARGGYDICEFEGRLSGAVKGAAIDTVTGALLGTVTPGSGTTSLDTTISALDNLEKLFEQRGILLILVEAAARAIAIHAGLGVIAPQIGQFAEQTVSDMLGPEDATGRPAAANLLEGAKIAAYVEAGALTEGITGLILTPVAESAIREETASIYWTKDEDHDPYGANDAYYDRVAPRLGFRDAAADGPWDQKPSPKEPNGLVVSPEGDAATATDPPADGLSAT
jgi:hypothetical protein